jgi:hypothetical protein
MFHERSLVDHVQHIKGQRTEYLNSIPEQDFQECFKACNKNLEKCIKACGVYSEGNKL